MSAVLDRLFDSHSSLADTGVLVVDNDPAVFLGLKTFLKEYLGFEQVFVARTINEAIELIQSEPSIELLTVDCESSELTETELLDQLRKHSPCPLGVTLITENELQREFPSSNSSTKLSVNQLPNNPFQFEKLEPIILESFDNLRGVKNQTECKEDSFMNQGFGLSNAELLNKVSFLEHKLDQNTQMLDKLRRTTAFRAMMSGVFSLIIISGLAILIWHQGWIKKGWEGLRNKPSVETNIQP